MSTLMHFRPVIGIQVIALALLTLTASPLVSLSYAALPATVDERPLPTLAPMIEQVTPAVVNISTESRVVGASSLTG